MTNMESANSMLSALCGHGKGVDKMPLCGPLREYQSENRINLE